MPPKGQAHLLLEGREYDTHIQKQDALAKGIEKSTCELELTYKLGRFADLKNRLKVKLLEQLNALNSDEKLAIILVDIQNDFTLPNFALYASGGQNTILSNMALLDAIIDLSNIANIKEKLEIITSQDAHRLGRTMNDAEARMMAISYTEEKALQAVTTEQRELEPFAPQKQSYGLHCITGTIGAAIAKPIEDRLNQLNALSFTITRFGKINFSGPAAGMRLKDDIDLSHKEFRDTTKVIYHQSNQSYIQFFREKQFKSIYVTGICGDVCVQQAAEGLKEELPQTKMTIIDACTHYLVIPDVKPYDTTREEVTTSYSKKDISIITLDAWRSNPDCDSSLYPINNTNSILAFYMHYPNACNAMLTSLAFASVVVAAILILGTPATAAAITGTAVGLGAIGGGLAFFSKLRLQSNIKNDAGVDLYNRPSVG